MPTFAEILKAQATDAFENSYQEFNTRVNNSDAWKSLVREMQDRASRGWFYIELTSFEYGPACGGNEYRFAARRLKELGLNVQRGENSTSNIVLSWD